MYLAQHLIFQTLKTWLDKKQRKPMAW